MELFDKKLSSSLKHVPPKKNHFLRRPYRDTKHRCEIGTLKSCQVIFFIMHAGSTKEVKTQNGWQKDIAERLDRKRIANGWQTDGKRIAGQI